MVSVLIIGVDRPHLAAALRSRGLAPADGEQPPQIALAANGAARPALPTVIEADAGSAAATLLDAGVDEVVLQSDEDCLVAARLAALVRRTQSTMLHVGDLVIHLAERRATRGGRSVALLPREYAVLLHLARNAGRTVSRAALRAAVWGLDFDPGTNVIEVHISRLRAKLEHGSEPPILLTDKGRGYRLAAAIAPDAPER